VLLMCLRLLEGTEAKCECVVGYSYTKYFSILLQSCARKITKICLYT